MLFRETRASRASALCHWCLSGSSTTSCHRPRPRWVSWTPTPVARWICSCPWPSRIGGGEHLSRTVVFPCARSARGRAPWWVSPSFLHFDHCGRAPNRGCEGGCRAMLFAAPLQIGDELESSKCVQMLDNSKEVTEKKVMTLKQLEVTFLNSSSITLET